MFAEWPAILAERCVQNFEAEGPLTNMVGVAQNCDYRVNRITATF